MTASSIVGNSDSNLSLEPNSPLGRSSGMPISSSLVERIGNEQVLRLQVPQQCYSMRGKAITNIAQSRSHQLKV
jgi:hypothetical protein